MTERVIESAQVEVGESKQTVHGSLVLNRQVGRLCRGEKGIQCCRESARRDPPRGLLAQPMNSQQTQNENHTERHGGYLSYQDNAMTETRGTISRHGVEA